MQQVLLHTAAYETSYKIGKYISNSVTYTFAKTVRYELKSETLHHMFYFTTCHAIGH